MKRASAEARERCWGRGRAVVDAGNLEQGYLFRRRRFFDADRLAGRDAFAFDAAVPVGNNTHAGRKPLEQLNSPASR